MNISHFTVLISVTDRTLTVYCATPSLLQGYRIVSGAHPVPLFNGHRGSFSGQNDQGVNLATPRHLIPKLILSGAIPPLPPCLHGMYKDTFILVKNYNCLTALPSYGSLISAYDETKAASFCWSPF